MQLLIVYPYQFFFCFTDCQLPTKRSLSASFSISYKKYHKFLKQYQSRLRSFLRRIRIHFRPSAGETLTMKAVLVLLVLGLCGYGFANIVGTGRKVGK